MKKILIGVPSQDLVSAQFAQSLAMLQRVPDTDTKVMFNIGSLVYDSRNTICQAAMHMEADYILWIDSDMVFPPDTLIRLMKDVDEGRDLVSCLCFYRKYPYNPVGYTKLTVEDDEIKEMVKIKGYPENEIIEMDAVGFGMVLMKTDILFDVAGQAGGHAVWFQPTPWAGEDCAFCVRARRAGYKLYLDTGIKIGHMGYLPITEDYFKATREREKANAGEGKTGAPDHDGRV